MVTAAQRGLSKQPRWLAVGLSVCLWAGCGSDGGAAPAGPGVVDLSQPVRVELSGSPPRYLSEYNFFAWDPETGFAFNDRVVPYDLNTPLFSDYALKQRAIYVPEGEVAAYDEHTVFALPVGSVLIKNFYFADDLRKPAQNPRLVETRLLVRYQDGIVPLPYIWDEAAQDAVLSPAGDVRSISFTDPLGEPRRADYLIPQRNQCEACHGQKAHEDDEADIVLIGIKSRHIDRDYDYGGDVGVVNQLEHLAELGMLDGLPPASERPRAAYDFQSVAEAGVEAIPEEDLAFAARSYLDIDCAHCHDPKAIQGITSRLFLNYDNTDLFNLGVCKRPGSAGAGNGGLTYNIVPGEPEASILYFRTHTEQVGAMMPVLGRSLADTRGAELLYAWIAAMDPGACSTEP